MSSVTGFASATIRAIIDAMTNQELETVVTYVKDRLPEPATQAPVTIPNDYFRLTERIVRVEEAIKNLNLLMEKRFEAMEKRFEDMNKRFETVDRRFEDLIHLMDKRFEDMNKRFEDMNKRFEAVDRRFEQMAKQAGNHFGWTIGIMSTLILALGALITVYRFISIGG